MDKVFNKNVKIIKNIIYSSMVFTLAYMLGLAIRIELNIPLQILMVLWISIIVNFFLLNPISLYILIAIIFIAVIFITRFFTPYMIIFLQRTYLLFENILDHIKYVENIYPENQVLFWGILVVLLSIFTGYIIFKNNKIYILLPIYIGSFLYYWYIHYDEAYWMIALFLLLFIILAGLDKYSKEKENIKNHTNVNFEKLYKPWLRTIIRYSFMIIILALLLPKSSKTIQWTWLEDKIQNTFPSIKNLRSTNTFSKKYGKAGLFDFSITGYQKESSRLGGPVILNEDLIMTIYGEGPIYLRGNVKLIYTGDTWEAMPQVWKSYKLGEDFSNTSKYLQENYYNKTSVEILYNSFASTTLFSPYKGSIVNFKDNGDHLKVGADGELIFPQGIYSNENYIVEVLSPLPYNQLLGLGINRKKENLYQLPSYLQIPKDRITDSTRELVKEIVKDAETDFEKALAIENHLRNNYRYTLDVEIVPENREFIDYFLFEGKEGYCTYYATAMAIMLRLEGIPTRYIEGYLADDSIEKGVYEVRHKNAHTWVEAFIEPVGWMIFEPTPAYPILDRIDESLLDESKEKIGAEEGEELNTKDRSFWTDIEMPRMEIDENLENGNINIDNEKNSRNIMVYLPKNTPVIIVGLLLLILSIKFIERFIKIQYQNYKITKLPNKERIIYLYNEIIKLTNLLGYNQKHGETHYEYANRIAHSFFLFATDKDLKEITEIFVKNKYSASPTPDEDILELESYRKTMERRLKNYLGFKTYYYGKYFK